MIRTIIILIYILFNSIDSVSQGKIAAVKLNGKWGFVDEQGKIVIPFEYDDVQNFSCGIAKVKKKFIWFYIDAKNQNIVKGKHYRCISNFISNRAIVFDSTLMKKVIITRTGEIVPTNNNIENIDHFSNGYARMRIFKESESDYNNRTPHDIVYGYLDTNGHVVVPAVYRHLFSFTKNTKFPLGYVRRDTKKGIGTYDKTWLYVKPNGSEIYCPEGYKIREFNSPIDPLKPFALCNDDSAYIMIRKDVLINNKNFTYYGFMNHSGQIVIEAKFLKAGNFNEGLAAVCEDGKNWGYINYEGRYVLTPRYEWASDFCEGIATVKDEYPKYITNEGVFICTGPENEKKVVYNSVTLPPSQKESFQNGMALRKKQYLFGYVNKNCELVVPYIYLDGKSFSNGLAAVKTKDGWGYIDVNGKVVIETKYEGAKPFVTLINETEETESNPDFKVDGNAE